MAPIVLISLLLACFNTVDSSTDEDCFQSVVATFDDCTTPPHTLINQFNVSCIQGNCQLFNRVSNQSKHPSGQSKCLRKIKPLLENRKEVLVYVCEEEGVWRSCYVDMMCSNISGGFSSKSLKLFTNPPSRCLKQMKFHLEKSCSRILIKLNKPFQGRTEIRKKRDDEEGDSRISSAEDEEEDEGGESQDEKVSYEEDDDEVYTNEEDPVEEERKEDLRNKEERKEHLRNREERKEDLRNTEERDSDKEEEEEEELEEEYEDEDDNPDDKHGLAREKLPHLPPVQILDIKVPPYPERPQPRKPAGPFWDLPQRNLPDNMILSPFEGESLTHEKLKKEKEDSKKQPEGKRPNKAKFRALSGEEENSARSIFAKTHYYLLLLVLIGHLFNH